MQNLLLSIKILLLKCSSITMSTLYAWWAFLPHPSQKPIWFRGGVVRARNQCILIHNTVQGGINECGIYTHKTYVVNSYHCQSPMSCSHLIFTFVLYWFHKTWSYTCNLYYFALLRWCKLLKFILVGQWSTYPTCAHNLGNPNITNNGVGLFVQEHSGSIIT